MLEAGLAFVAVMDDAVHHIANDLVVVVALGEGSAKNVTKARTAV